VCSFPSLAFLAEASWQEPVEAVSRSPRRRGGRQEHTNERSMALVLAWCQNQKEARAVTIARPDKELTRTGAPPTPATRRACESFRELGIPRDVSPGEKGT
jgi:hypothetical protein